MRNITMSLIRQRHQQDCGVACLAMFMGKSYGWTEAFLALKLKRNVPIEGMNNVELAKILKMNGYEPMQMFTLCRDIPAIVSVPSLGNKKSFHYVYWDGKNIKDPSRYDVYTTRDFVKTLPMADSVICKKNVEIQLPSHFYNEFDWEFINKENENL